MSLQSFKGAVMKSCVMYIFTGQAHSVPEPAGKGAVSVSMWSSRGNRDSELLNTIS